MPPTPRSPSAGRSSGPAIVPTEAFAGNPPLVLNRLAVVVGSQAGCHLHLISQSISKHHALIVVSHDGTYVRDLGSRAHTIVNGTAVREQLLAEGDHLRFGNFTFAYTAGGYEVAPRDVPSAASLRSPSGDERHLRGRVALLGRRKGSDFALRDPTVGSAHAVIFEANGKRYIRDLDSRTGTFVNGAKVRQAELNFGDTIRVGDSVFSYVASLGALSESADELEELVGTAPLVSEFGLESEGAGAPAAAPSEEDHGDEQSDLIPLDLPDEPPAKAAGPPGAAVSANVVPLASHGPQATPAMAPTTASPRSSAAPAKAEPRVEPRLDEIDLEGDADSRGSEETAVLPPPPPRPATPQVPLMADPLADLPVLAEEPPPAQPIEPAESERPDEPGRLLNRRGWRGAPGPAAAPALPPAPAADHVTIEAPPSSPPPRRSGAMPMPMPVPQPVAVTPPPDRARQTPSAPPPLPAQPPVEPPAPIVAAPAPDRVVEPPAPIDIGESIEPFAISEPPATDDAVSAFPEPVENVLVEPAAPVAPPPSHEIEAITSVAPADEFEPIEPVAAADEPEPIAPVAPADERPAVAAAAPQAPPSIVTAEAPVVVVMPEPLVTRPAPPPLPRNLEPIDLRNLTGQPAPATRSPFLDSLWQPATESHEHSEPEHDTGSAVPLVDIPLDDLDETGEEPPPIVPVQRKSDPTQIVEPAVEMKRPPPAAPEPIDLDARPPDLKFDAAQDSGGYHDIEVLDPEQPIEVFHSTASDSRQPTSPLALPGLEITAADFDEPPAPAIAAPAPEVIPVAELGTAGEIAEVEAPVIEEAIAQIPESASPAGDRREVLDASEPTPESAQVFDTAQVGDSGASASSGETLAAGPVDMTDSTFARAVQEFSGPGLVETEVASVPSATSPPSAPSPQVVPSEIPRPAAVQPQTLPVEKPTIDTPPAVVASSDDAGEFDIESLALDALASDDVASAPSGTMPSGTMPSGTTMSATTSAARLPPFDLVEPDSADSSAEPPVSGLAADNSPTDLADLPEITPPEAIDEAVVTEPPVAPPVQSKAQVGATTSDPAIAAVAGVSTSTAPVVPTAAIAATTSVAAVAAAVGEAAAVVTATSPAKPAAPAAPVAPPPASLAPPAPPAPAAPAPEPLVWPPVSSQSGFDPFAPMEGMTGHHLGGMPLKLAPLAPPPPTYGKVGVAFGDKSIRPGSQPSQAPGRMPAAGFAIGEPGTSATPAGSSAAPPNAPPSGSARPPGLPRPPHAGRRPTTPFSSRPISINPEELVNDGLSVYATPFTEKVGRDIPAAGFEGLAMPPIQNRDVFAGESARPISDAAFGGRAAPAADSSQILKKGGPDSDFAADPFWNRTDEEDEIIPLDLSEGGEAIGPDGSSTQLQRSGSIDSAGDLVVRPIPMVSVPGAAARRRKRNILPMLMIGMLLCMGGAAAGIYFLVPIRSSIEAAAVYSYYTASEAQRRQFIADQEQLVVSPATLAHARELALARGVAFPGFLAESHSAELVRAVNAAKWVDRHDGTAALTFNFEDVDPDHNDDQRITVLMQAMNAGNGQVSGISPQEKMRMPQIQREIDETHGVITELNIALADAQAHRHAPNPAALTQLRDGAARLRQEWLAASAQVAADRDGLDSMRVSALGGGATPAMPATQPTDDAELAGWRADLKTAQSQLASPSPDQAAQLDTARHVSDQALMEFQAQLDSSEAALKDDTALTGFALVVQKIQETTAASAAALLQLQQDQQARSSELRRQLDDDLRDRANEIWQNDPDLKQLSDELNLDQHQLDQASGTMPEGSALQALRDQVEQARARLAQRQQVLGDDDSYQKSIDQLREAINASAAIFENQRRQAIDQIGNLSSRLDSAVPPIATMTGSQRDAIELLSQKTGDLLVARRQFIRTIPGTISGSDDATSQISAHIADLQNSIDARRVEHANQVRRLLDDSKRLALYQTMDARQSQFTTHLKAQADAQAAVLAKDAELRQQITGAAVASGAEDQADRLFPQITDAQKKLDQLTAEQTALQEKVGQSIIPRQPSPADVRVTPLESHLWWYVGSISGVWLVFMILMIVTTRGGDTVTEPTPDMVSAGWIQSPQGGPLPANGSSGDDPDDAALTA